MFCPNPPDLIYYCYGVYDEEYNTLPPEVIMHHGLPSKEEIESWTNGQQHALLVLDDLMCDVVKSPEVEALFTRGCHHRHMSLIYVTQNLFAQGTAARTIALNTSYLVLFKTSEILRRYNTWRVRCFLVT